MNWLWLIIVGVVLLLIAWYLRRPDAPANPPILRWVLDVIGAICLVVGLLLFVLWIAGLGTPTAPARGAAPLTGFLVLGAFAADTPGSGAVATFVWQYIANVVLVLASLISAVGTFITINPQVNAGWLGLSDIQWHWALLVIGVVTILYNGLTHAPPLTAPPTKARMARLRAGLPVY